MVPAVVEQPAADELRIVDDGRPADTERQCVDVAVPCNTSGEQLEWVPCTSGQQREPCNPGPGALRPAVRGVWFAVDALSRSPCSAMAKFLPAWWIYSETHRTCSMLLRELH